MNPGDLVLTNFFGEPHRICLVLRKQGPQPYGWEPPCLVLLQDGTQVLIQRDSLLTMDEFQS